MCGNKSPHSWSSKEQPVDFYSLKSYIAAILEKIAAITSFQTQILEYDSVFSFGYSLKGNSGEIVKAGKVKEEILKDHDIKGDVYFADFNWKVLMQQMSMKLQVKEINRFPAVTRDLALIINKDVQFSTLSDIATKTERELLKDISVFDVYEGKGMEDGKKSYALRFLLQSESKTLSDKEIEKTMEKLTKAFSEKAGAIIRSS